MPTAASARPTGSQRRARASRAGVRTPRTTRRACTSPTTKLHGRSSQARNSSCASTYGFSFSPLNPARPQHLHRTAPYPRAPTRPTSYSATSKTPTRPSRLTPSSSSRTASRRTISRVSWTTTRWALRMSSAGRCTSTCKSLHFSQLTTTMIGMAPLTPTPPGPLRVARPCPAALRAPPSPAQPGRHKDEQAQGRRQRC